jgi:hypothetical protein
MSFVTVLTAGHGNRSFLVAFVRMREWPNSHLCGANFIVILIYDEQGRYAFWLGLYALSIRVLFIISQAEVMKKKKYSMMIQIAENFWRYCRYTMKSTGFGFTGMFLCRIIFI